ncbi:tRNA (adenosine(37)-N6)-threonylcarbamoyltransferase complex ATPase subunit type 1 TsaE [Pseudocolwellia sp. AS88]|uniref:tRNA (adenosine(37)-N6)-threonylcarbamoyltransferase complex ATPase subunit type 1 TsaE n=1 Tax=Pseudocolwellia sp. AS88 TaxID=3063958 RepID=UPI0026F12D86|nr:tRNA (adenosine(37)-N6)-threonylcarbamoyltransferase complex ATPase subunit type 1 TsaE [Pseudocolwellia sp. AS88]MDO7084079.1 tRNA (adenosine(37)-N6)-threonylcarbamoyltransferase complex ATPase subunit type 1 TsaE [Pseudocolwellia sp. AS88]
MNKKTDTLRYDLVDSEDTIAMGNTLAQLIKNELKKGLIVYLHGELGAGKTTLTRGFVQGMGHKGNVKSPTYTLVEPYELNAWNVYHFDLYRLADPEELEYMGIRDYFGENSCCFIEWPEKGEGLLPKPDLILTIEYVGSQRQVTLESKTELSQLLLDKMLELPSQPFNTCL